jgi:hypothetical protein
MPTLPGKNSVANKKANLVKSGRGTQPGTRADPQPSRIGRVRKAFVDVERTGRREDLPGCLPGLRICWQTTSTTRSDSTTSGFVEGAEKDSSSGMSRCHGPPGAAIAISKTGLR